MLKSGKPSNAILLAERKAIAALLENEVVADLDGASNVDRVRALIGERDRYKDGFPRPRGDGPAAGLPIRPEGEFSPPTRGWPASPIAPQRAMEPLEDGGDVPEIVSARDVTGPIDRAQYPGMPGQIQSVPAPNPAAMTTAQGDMTPGYVRWFLSTNGPEAVKERYGERIIYLPPDVREALL